MVEYVDKGVSGRKDSRPALDALLAACRRREHDTVAVVRLDDMETERRPKLPKTIAVYVRVSKDDQHPEAA